MSPVFAHGRLRLYLLKLLDEAPRHGYEVIRLLEERFHGMYAPSAGTVYPRLAKLEQEGLVEHTVEGGRKVYRITDAGREELTARGAELDELEAEIHDSVSLLADQIREDVRDSARDLREEMARAAREARQGGTSARTAREEARQVKVEARRFKEQLREALREPEALADLAKTLSGLADAQRWMRTDPFGEATAPPKAADGDALKELARLLDRFRDEIRDTARDRGVSDNQLRTAREILADATTKLRRLLNG
jgi:DNA-binding PadR family transcriptional regulator